MAEETVSITLKLKDSASRGASAISKALGGIKAAAKGLTIAAAAVTGVGLAIAEMAARGEDLRALRGSFAKLAADVEGGAAAMLTAMQEGASGMISATELMEGANVILGGGIKATTEQMATLAKAADVVGDAMGKSAPEAMKIFSQAMATGRTQTLGTMGVVVDIASETKKFAEEQGKAVDELTNAEKKTALFDATVRILGETMERVQGVAVGFGGSFDQAKVSLVDFKDDMFVFTSLMGDQLLPIFTSVLGITDQFGKALEFNAAIAADFVKTGLKFLIDGFVIATGAVFNLLDVFNLLQIGMGMLAAAFIKGWQLMLEPLELALRTMQRAAAALGADGLAGTAKIAADAVSGFTDDMSDAAQATFEWGVQGVRDIEANRAALDSVSDSAATLAGAIAAVDTSKVVEGMAGVAEGATIAAEAVEKIPEALADTGKAADKAGKEIKKAAEDSFREGIVGAIAGGDAKAAVSNLGELLEDVSVLGIDIGAILSAITSINKDLPKLLFASLKSLLINLIAELPLLIGNIIPDLIVPLLELVPVIIQRFVENLPVMIKAIILAIPSLIQALISMGPNMMKAYIMMLDSAMSEFFPNWWKEQKPILMDQAREVAFAALDKILTEWPSVWSVMGAEIAAWWERVMWKGITEDIGEMMSSLADQFMESIVQPFVDAYLAVWDQTFGRFPEMATEAGEFLVAPIRTFLDNFKWPEVKLPGEGGGDGGTLGEIGGAIESATGISFRQGTNFVPETGPALLHRGEAVIPAEQNMGGGGGINISINVDARGAAASDAERISRVVNDNIRGVADDLRRIILRTG